MLRLTPAGRALLAGGGFTVTDATSRRAGAGGCSTPGSCTPSRTAGGPGPRDVTVVVPVKDRTEAVARLLAALPADLGGVIVVDDGSADPGRPACGRRAAPGPACCATPPPRSGRRAQRRARGRGDPARRLPRLRRAARPRLARRRCWRTWPTRPSGWSRRGSSPSRRSHGWLGRYEAVRSSLDLGPDPARRRAAHPRRLRPERRAARAPRRGRSGLRRGHARRRGRRPRAAPARRGLAAALRADVAGRARPPHRTCGSGGCARPSTARAPPRSRCGTPARCRRWC